MRLEPDASNPGLWANPDWKASDGGVFALIIGVSRYDHLTDGAGPLAPSTYGLGQLAVSALTAYRFFDWLRSGYALDGFPVARARLLLSPLKKGVGNSTSDELAGCDPAICGHAAEATFANCKSAIEYWYADMQGAVGRKPGRSLFFFSGHGLEIRTSHQVLLPSDYLRPPTQPLNESISTRNLIDCLPYLTGVASHVLLLDGCRNDADDLRSSKVEGFDILNDAAPSSLNPNYEKGVIFATASGLRAYQPREKGISLFGQALLDGLKTRPDPVLDEAPIELRRKGNVCTVEINKLASYMKGRVSALIKASNEDVVQIVRADVSSADLNRPIALAEIIVASPKPAGRGLPQSTDFSDGGPMVEEVFIDTPAKAQKQGRGSDEPSAKIVKHRSHTRWFQQRYPLVVKAGEPISYYAQDAQHIDRLHQLFGSEAITYPWFETLHLTCLATRKTWGHAAVNIFSVRHAGPRNGSHRVQIHFAPKISDSLGYLLTINDGSGRPVACTLPTDHKQPSYQLEIDVGENHFGQHSFMRFAAFLSSNKYDALGAVAQAWENVRALDAVAAARLMQRKGLATEIESTLRDKMASPLAATVAALILLKGNRFDLMHDWPRNLANWFPSFSDGAILWTEQCRRQVAGQQLDPHLIPWFVKTLSARSLPFTAECFGIAVDIVRDIKRGRLKTDKRTRDGASVLGERLDSVMPYFRDGGLFCTYAAWPTKLQLVGLISPPKRKRLPRTSRSREKGRSDD